MEAFTREYIDSIISNNEPTPEFWDLWREDKLRVKGLGYNVKQIEDRKWRVEYKQPKRAYIQTDKNLDYSKLFPLLNKIPKDFQLEAIRFGINRECFYIADEMGLGKTFESLSIIEYNNTYPCLVLCPLNAKPSWELEIIDKLKNKTYQFIDSKTIIEEGKHFYIIHYDILDKRQHDLKAISFNSCIADEIHYLSTEKNKRYKAAIQITKSINNIIGLSGTPILNQTRDLVGQLRFLKLLDSLFGNTWSFLNRYCDPKPNYFGTDWSGSSNQEELNEKLKLIMIRRKKEEVLKELPAKQYIDKFFQLDNYIEYIRARTDIVKYFRSKEFLQKELAAKKAEELVKLNYLRKLTAEGKLNGVYEFIDEFIKTKTKLVLFALHREIIDSIVDKYKCYEITGSHEERQSIVHDFQNNPDTILTILNVKSGTEAITLTSSCNVAFIELPWNPGKYNQATDRVHRIGQTDQVTVYNLLGSGSIDVKIMDIIKSKQSVSDSVIDGIKSEEEDTDMIKELVKHFTN